MVTLIIVTPGAFAAGASRSCHIQLGSQFAGSRELYSANASASEALAVQRCSALPGPQTHSTFEVIDCDIVAWPNASSKATKLTTQLVMVQKLERARMDVP